MIAKGEGIGIRIDLSGILQGIAITSSGCVVLTEKEKQKQLEYIVWYESYAKKVKKEELLEEIINSQRWESRDWRIYEKETEEKIKIRHLSQKDNSIVIAGRKNYYWIREPLNLRELVQAIYKIIYQPKIVSSQENAPDILEETKTLQGRIEEGIKNIKIIGYLNEENKIGEGLIINGESEFDYVIIEKEKRIKGEKTKQRINYRIKKREKEEIADVLRIGKDNIIVISRKPMENEAYMYKVTKINPKENSYEQMYPLGIFSRITRIEKIFSEDGEIYLMSTSIPRELREMKVKYNDEFFLSKLRETENEKEKAQRLELGSPPSSYILDWPDIYYVGGVGEEEKGKVERKIRALRIYEEEGITKIKELLKINLHCNQLVKYHASENKLIFLALTDTSLLGFQVEKNMNKYESKELFRERIVEFPDVLGARMNKSLIAYGINKIVIIPKRKIEELLSVKEDNNRPEDDYLYKDFPEPRGY